MSIVVTSSDFAQNMMMNYADLIAVCTFNYSVTHDARVYSEWTNMVLARGTAVVDDPAIVSNASKNAPGD
jgi:hypothetical protein